MSGSNQVGVLFSGVVTTGRAPVDMCLTNVEADMGDEEGADVVADVVAGGSFFSPEVARFLEAAFLADDKLRAKSCSCCARAFAVGFFGLVPDSRAIRIFY